MDRAEAEAETMLSPTSRLRAVVQLGSKLARQAQLASAKPVTVTAELALSPTVADLHAALLPEAVAAGARHLLIDGQLCRADQLLAVCPLYEGAEIELPAPAEREDSDPAERVASSPELQPAEAMPDIHSGNPAQGKSALVVVGGLQSASQADFGFARVVVGRHPSADLQLLSPAVSLQHLLLYSDALGTGHASDLNSANGFETAGQPGCEPVCWPPGSSLHFKPGQRLYLPGAVLEWRLLTAQPSAATGSAPKLEFQRPPKQTPPPAMPPLQLPDLDSQQSQLPLRPPTWATIAVPLVMGLALALLVNPYMALFALMGPTMAIALWLEGRRHNKRAGKQRRRKFKAVLEQCETHYYQAAAREVERRRFEHPDPATTLDWASQAAGRLWSGAGSSVPPGSPNGFLQLAVGRHSLPWQPAVQLGAQPQPANSKPATADSEPAKDDRAAAELSPKPARKGRWKSRSAKPKPSHNLALQDEVSQLFQTMPPLRDVPLALDFSGGAVGIAGAHADAVLRWLVLQAACRYGPAELRLVALATEADLAGLGWEWLAWLPQVQLVTAATAADGLAVLDAANAELADPAPPGSAKHTWLLLLRPPKQLPALPPGTSAVVLSRDLAELPGNCRVCLEALDGLGRGRVIGGPAAASQASANLAQDDSAVWLDGLPQPLAARAARQLARLADPLASQSSQRIPGRVALAELLELASVREFSAQCQQAIWSQSRQARTFAAPIGQAEAGVVWLDLPRDGPHALIAGTTGSGKSELLRCMVASLAVNIAPERLNFVLLDYKGGSAFDACAQLPHVVGLVTDLDERLGERALTCLRAELTYRERFLRAAGVSELAQLEAQEASCGLARLVVMVDEFASLASELPGFLESLIGIAQRGRSLGVHLLLATQRPTGVVSPEIRSNTNLRIGLRMLDQLDSQDVLASPVAADLSPDQPGRGFIRLGAAEAQAFQVASVSGVTEAASAAPVTIDSGMAAVAPAAGADSSQATDLELFVATARQAWQQQGEVELRCPWPEPLPDQLSFETLHQQLRQQFAQPSESASHAVPVGWADFPQEQTQRCHWWKFADSNLFLLGQTGSGVADCLLSTALLLTAAAPPSQLHIYGLDFGSAGLAGLSSLPQVGTIASQADPETCLRLLDFVLAELGDRQGAPAQLGDRQGAPAGRTTPQLVLLLDNLGAALHWLEESRDFTRLEKLIRLVVDGPAWQITTLMAAESLAAVPRRMLASANQQLLFYEPDELAMGSVGQPLVPGRAFLRTATKLAGASDDGLEMQTASCGELAATVADIAAGIVADSQGGLPDNSGRQPKQLAALPAQLSLAELAAAAAQAAAASPVAGVISIPLGLGYDQTIAQLQVRAGAHVAVCGPARSGKSFTLRLLAQQLAQAGAQTVALCPASSPLAAEPTLVATAVGVADLLAATEATISPEQPIWLFIDELFDSPQLLSVLLEQAASSFHFAVAAKPGFFRTCPHAWLPPVLASQTGILLAPAAADLELLGAGSQPGSEPGVVPPGRAAIVNQTQASWCQLAQFEAS